MDIQISLQINNFVMAVFLGIFLSLFYDISQAIIYLIGSEKRKVFIRDVVYFIFCGIVTFLFILAVNSGEIRVYFFIGEVIGFFLYKLTIGGVILYWTKFLQGKFVKLKNKVIKIIPINFIKSIKKRIISLLNKSKRVKTLEK